MIRSRLHINYLELKAAFLALQVFSSQENSTHPDKDRQYHGHSLYQQTEWTLSNLALQIWEWCLNRKITIQAEHIPGRHNKEADKESRKGADYSNWRLHPEILFKELNSRWGSFDIDLFAARHNTQLMRFYSYHLDLSAEAVDALSQPWSDLPMPSLPSYSSAKYSRKSGGRKYTRL